jgi:hypothetical protein
VFYLINLRNFFFLRNEHRVQCVQICDGRGEGGTGDVFVHRRPGFDTRTVLSLCNSNCRVYPELWVAVAVHRKNVLWVHIHRQLVKE